MRVYMQNKCNNPKSSGEFWQAIKPLISQKCIKKNDNIILSNDGSLVNNKADVSKLFNEYLKYW